MKGQATGWLQQEDFVKMNMDYFLVFAAE